MIDIEEMHPLGQYEITALYNNYPVDYDSVDTEQEAEEAKIKMLEEHGNSTVVQIINKG